MKKITLKKASELYEEVKYYKQFGNYVCIYIHNDEIKVGYMNKLGTSDFIRNNEKRFIIFNEYKTSILTEDYFKEDAVKMILTLCNSAIEEYEEIKNFID